MGIHPRNCQHSPEQTSSDKTNGARKSQDPQIGACCNSRGLAPEGNFH